MTWSVPAWRPRHKEKEEDEVEMALPPDELVVSESVTGEPEIEVAPSVPQDEETGVMEAVPFDDEPAEKAAVGRNNDSSLLTFKDHISLMERASTVRFRNAHVRVYQHRNIQFQIEHGSKKKGDEDEDEDEDGGEDITMKIVKDGTVGLLVLRAAYTLVGFLFVGFLFIFCMQVLLFLFLNMAVESGATSKQEINFLPLFATILSAPAFIHGMGSAMNLGWTFVTETWGGMPFLRSLAYGKWRVIVEWTTFIVHVLIPISVMFISLFAGADNWWEITALTWFTCLFIFYLLHSMAMIGVEIMGCLELVRHSNGFSELPYTNFFSFFKLLKMCIILRQRSNYSGSKQCSYFVDGANDAPEKGRSYTEDWDGSVELYAEKRDLFTRITQLSFLRCIFKTLEKPTRIYSIDEVKGVVPFITSKNWSLEKLYCRNRDSRAVAVVGGPAALKRNQVRSSFICAIIGNFITLLFFFSFLVWLDVSGLFIGLAVIIIIAIAVPTILRTIGLMQVYTQMKAEKSKKGNSEALYQVWEKFRITQAKDRFCWTMFVLENIFLFFFPLVMLLATSNHFIAFLFFVVASLSGARYYMNAAIVLQELGSLEHLGPYKNEDRAKQIWDWTEKARLSLVISKIGWGKRRDVWIKVFTGIVFFITMIVLGAVGIGSNQGAKTSYRMLPDFSYPAQPNLPYPTCQMGKGIEVPGGQQTSLIDYVFLASVAYENPNSTQTRLDEWFGSGAAKDEQTVVNEYRDATDKGTSAVTFKLISFPLQQGQAIVSIRGTANGWDMLTDAQLWSAAALTQFVRALLPIGEIWTPIFNNLVRVVSLLETKSLDKVAFYKTTTKFVESLQKDGTFTNLAITGHSLGGGLAMISAAQTGIPGIGLSGPNAKISRDTFDPPLTLAQIDQQILNIVPDRDVVPMIDDLGQLYQRIQCRTSPNDPIGCHTATRSLCEVMYTCGTGDRPAICECVTEYGYEEPKQIGGNKTFAEACRASV